MSHERADVDVWCRDVAPSRDLRDWYQHDATKFAEFETRYRAELREGVASNALADLRARLQVSPLTLLTASRAVGISQAAVLAKVLAEPSA
jgi:uncharacterized protein YeaO (DUF488 family)